MLQTLEKGKPRLDLASRQFQRDGQKINRFFNLDIPAAEIINRNGLQYDIFACHFDNDGRGRGDHNSPECYARCLAAFEKSVAMNAPKARLRIERRKTSDLDSRLKAWWANNLLKAKTWTDMAQEIERPTVFMDIDTVVLGELANGFQREVTITRRDSDSWFNSGVVFVEPTNAVKKLFRDWLDKAVYFYNDQHELRRASGIHVGLHQTSFIHLLMEGKIKAEVGVLDGHIWNATRACWKRVTKDTRVIHATSKLRQQIFIDKEPSKWHDAVKRYREFL